MTATEFYQVNLAKQRQIIEEAINKAKDTGDPVITLPFDTYPVIEKEMEDLGWVYESYEDSETGKQFAMFFPKQYQYDSDDE